MRKIFLSAFIIYSLQCYTQNRTIDSLRIVLQSAKKDTTKINTLNWLAYQLRNNNPDTAIYFADKAIALATKTNYKIGIANAFLWKGVAVMNLGKYEESLKNSIDALKIYDELITIAGNTGNASEKSEILNLKAKAYNNIGLIYRQQGNYQDALKNSFIALKIRIEIGDKTGIATSYSNIGLMYNDQGNNTEALKYDFASLKMRKEVGNKKGMADSYNNIGLIYNDQGNYPEALKNYFASLKIGEEIGDKAGNATTYDNIGIIYGKQGNYTEALKNHFAALKIENEIGDKAGIARCYNNIAVIYIYQKNYSEALKSQLICLKISEEIGDKSSAAQAYYNIGVICGNQGNYTEALKNDFNALKIQEEIGDKEGMAESYIDIGNIYANQKKNTDALVYLNKGLWLAKQTGNIEYVQNAYKYLANLDSARGDFKQSLQMYKLFINYRDSLFNEENTKKLVQSQMQYEFDKQNAVAKSQQDKKDAETKRIKNQQLFTILMLVIIVLAVVIIAAIQFRSNRHKQKANFALQHQKDKVESALAELKSTQAQLIQSEKMASLGELTAGIAHEIQNPLNFVNNFSEVNNELIEELKIKNEKLKIEDDEIKELINDIKDNSEKINHHGKRADAIVKNMLQHSRKSSGQKEPTDINTLCDEYLRLAYHGLRAKDKEFNAEIKTDFDKSIGKINIVPQDIGRVLLNLFNNALYAVNKPSNSLKGEQYKPLVSVSTRKITPLQGLGAKVEIKVTDNGNGIPQTIVDKIFQPFFTTKPTGEGTGLGLSLSYDIIKAHGGEIKVETKENEGSRFIIQLPVA